MKQVKYIIIGLVMCLCLPIHGLSLEEEFELYKEFKNIKLIKQIQNDEYTHNHLPQYRPAKKKYRNYQKSLQVNRQRQYYNQFKKRPIVGASLSVLMPTFGHAYSAEWSRGVPFLLTELFGIYLSYLSVEQKQQQEQQLYRRPQIQQESESKLEITNPELFYAGIGIFVVARIAEAFDAYSAVNEYNQKLKRGLGLIVEFDDDATIKTSVKYQF